MRLGNRQASSGGLGTVDMKQESRGRSHSICPQGSGPRARWRAHPGCIKRERKKLVPPALMWHLGPCLPQMSHNGRKYWLRETGCCTDGTMLWP